MKIRAQESFVPVMEKCLGNTKAENYEHLFKIFPANLGDLNDDYAKILRLWKNSICDILNTHMMAD